MVRFKKGIRILIGIPIIIVSSILFTIGMQIFNVVGSIILFIGHIFVGQWTLSAEKFVEFISYVITAPFAVILAIISAPFVAVMLSIDTFWKEEKTLSEMVGLIKTKKTN